MCVLCSVRSILYFPSTLQTPDAPFCKLRGFFRISVVCVFSGLLVAQVNILGTRLGMDWLLGGWRFSARFFEICYDLGWPQIPIWLRCWVCLGSYIRVFLARLSRSAEIKSTTHTQFLNVVSRFDQVENMNFEYVASFGCPLLQFLNVHSGLIVFVSFGTPWRRKWIRVWLQKWT